MDRHTKGSWLDGYLRYTDVLESPEIFNFWVGVSLLSAVMDRNFHYPYGYFDIYPNTFVILVAGTQRCRKSTSISVGKKLLLEMANPPYVLSQKVTPQALIGALSERAEKTKSSTGKPKASGLLVADEIATYLDANSIKMGMIPVLLKLHDADPNFEYQTRTHGTEYMKNSYLTLLCGSAPEYLRKSLPIDEVGGGMLSRTILVYSDKPRKARPFLELDTVHKKIKQDLVADLELITKLGGEFEMTPEAYDWYSNWYTNEWFSGKEQKYLDNTLKYYSSKKPDHMISLAQIISIAESNTLEITVKHLKSAHMALKTTEKNMHKPLSFLVAEGSGLNTKLVLDAIAEIIAYNQQPTLKRILQRTHKQIDYEETQRGLQTLVVAGIVDERRNANNIAFYVPTKGKDETML